MFWCVHTRSNENKVVSHSLDYTESYEIDVGTHGFYHVVESVVKACWNTKYISLHVLWRPCDTLLLIGCDESHYTLHDLASSL